MNLIAISQSIRNFHENPRLAQFSTTTTGRFAIWIAASMLIWPSQRVWWLSPLLALFLYRPTWRRELLCIGSLAFLFDLLGWRLERNHLFIQLPVVAFSLSLIYFTFRAGRSYKGLPVTLQKHPLLYLNLGIWPLILTAWILPMHVNESWRPSIVPFRWILPLLVWRLGYLLLAGKRGSMQGSSFRDHLWYCLPAVGGTNVPYGKGFDYLNANRADEPESIARTQLAGIKLLVLARLWEWMLLEMDALVYQQTEGILPGILPAIPVRLLHLGDLIAGADASIPVKWMSLFGELVYFTFSLAAMGHLIIGSLRLFGYNVFRNTYKPLLAETILDFWNRLYFYFKELLVEFFFFPVFAQCFRKNPRLRMFAAVMAAAFLGNVYYHILRDFGMLGRAGPVVALEILIPRIFYSFLLGLGIFISMQRQQSRRGIPPSPGLGRQVQRVWGIAVVWLFFSIIHIWNVEPIQLSFETRSLFFLSLFGLS